MSGSPAKPASPAPLAAAATSTTASAHADAAVAAAHADTLATLAVTLDEAQAAFHRRAYDLAAQLFSQIAEATARIYGPTHPKSADAHFRYGRALLNHAIEKAGILGDAEQVRNATNGKREMDLLNAVEEGMMPSKDLSRFHFGHEEGADADADATGAEGNDEDYEDTGDDDGDEAEDDGDGEEGDGDDEEVEDIEEDDFEIAFEALDVARIIYSKMLTGELPLDATDLPSDPNQAVPATPSADAKGKAKAATDASTSAAAAARLAVQRRYAEVLSTLADVSLESESFGQAVEDYTRALELQQSILPPHDRRLAETHYKLALALEYAEATDLERALVHLSHARAVLDAKLRELEKEGTDRALLEASEIQSLLPELDLKVDDVKRAIHLRDHPEEKDPTEEEEVADARKRAEGKPVNDLTGLIKKKATPAGSAAAGASDTAAAPNSPSKKRKLGEVEPEEPSSPSKKKQRAEA